MTLAVKTRIVGNIPRDRETLSMFVVYYNPKDFPGKVVVREHASRPGEVLVLNRPATVCDTVAEARAAIPGGLTRLPRHDRDDPVILETWV